MLEQIPYENYLSASVIENIIQRMLESDASKSFWFKNSGYFNEETYKGKVSLNIECYVKEDEKLHYQKREISNLFAELFRNYKKEVIHWNYIVKEENDLIKVSLTATIDAVKIPVKIYFYKVKENKIRPVKTEEALLTDQDRKLEIYYFPGEQILAERFLEIMEKMELINDLNPYYDIYEILKKEAISGRQVWELLSRECPKRCIAIEEKRFQTLVSYRKNRFMIKKWKNFLRHEKKISPTWDELLDLFELFFQKIWDSLCNNVIYLGDWMPELGRFID